MVMTEKDAYRLLLLIDTLLNLELVDDETSDRVIELYQTTEMLWDRMRHETDYDDYH